MGRNMKGEEGEERTLLLQDLELFVMSPAQLGPFGELVLCAYRVELFSDS